MLFRPVRRSSIRRAATPVALLAAVLVAGAALPARSAPAPAASPTAAQAATAQAGTELSETTRLADRRSLVVGDRAYAMGDETGLYPATGWHIRGEMGGFWTQPIKMLDGVWFALGSQWLGKDAAAARYTSGHGYSTIDYQAADGVRVQRTDFAPDGMRATLIGLTLSSSSARTVRLGMDAHSELMASYPWGWTTPNAGTTNLQDTGSYADGSLRFRDIGRADVPNVAPHDYAAVVGSSLRPVAHALGPDHRGPQDPAVVCPGDGPAPAHCDDSAFGRGTGGGLSYDVRLGSKPVTVWFAVAGSDDGPAAALKEHKRALKSPWSLLKAKTDDRAGIAGRTVVDLPGDRLLQRSVEWSKQNLADSVQESHNMQLRDVDEGRAYPAPAGTLDQARWFGAGFPDYPWLFATDGEYTAYAAVAAGQFDTVKTHLRALRDISDIVNARSGKVVHEVMPTGDVYFGTNHAAGNTDETVKFPSVVALLWRWTGDDRFRDQMYDFAVRNLQYVYRELDDDGDGWPEGLGNVERAGMGAEKLDSTVYLARGLRDLADLAASKHDTAIRDWATGKADDIDQRFEAQWWYGGDANGYADSIDDPADPANDNTRIFQRHWIGVTPMEVELTRPGKPAGPLASDEHGRTALAQRERPCYTGQYGLFHTGSGPTSDPAGNPGPSCDSVVSAVRAERSIFSLNTAIMAVAEGNFGRLAANQQGVYTTGNARIQLDPSVWETPGAMPEIAPSPDFVANIDRPFYDRSMALQAWGAYGILWPVVHQFLGVSPDLGRDRVSVVPQVPAGQPSVAGRNVVLGKGSADVTAWASGTQLRTDVKVRGPRLALTIGAVLPAGASVKSVSLDGHGTAYQLVNTTRGTEVHVSANGGSTSSLRITLN
jgi:hypothetical protein